jgi:chromate transporter
MGKGITEYLPVPYTNLRDSYHPPTHRRSFVHATWTTAFGGPAALIAMMQHEFVTRRGWLTNSRFLDLVGVTNLIPGPNSTEMALHLGRERAGWIGLTGAGIAFIMPASILMTGLA